MCFLQFYTYIDILRLFRNLQYIIYHKDFSLMKFSFMTIFKYCCIQLISTHGKCCSCSDENTFWIDMIIIELLPDPIQIHQYFFYQRKSLEQELNQGSVLALPLAILVGVAIYNYQKVNLITKLLDRLFKVCNLTAKHLFAICFNFIWTFVIIARLMNFWMLETNTLVNQL